MLVLLPTGDSGKVTTVVATPGQGPDRPQEVSYTDIKVIGNGSFGVVYQARLFDTQEMVAIKKVLQDKRFKVCFDGFSFFPSLLHKSLISLTWIPPLLHCRIESCKL